MKRIFTLALVAVMSLGALNANAQNKFKGIVKYELTSVGSTPVEIKPDQATTEYKVMGDQVMQGESAKQNGRTLYSFQDLSQLLAYLSMQDITIESYQGDGKVYVKQTYTQEQIDSLTIPCTEGYYVEYVNGETKKIAGYDTKKAIVHAFGEDGEDHPMEVWYCPEIGPAVNFIVLGVGINGMPLEFVQNGQEGRAIKLTCSEVIKGKVKDVDFLMPAGFKELAGEELEAFQKELQEAFELLQD